MLEHVSDHERAGPETASGGPAPPLVASVPTNRVRSVVQEWACDWQRNAEAPLAHRRSGSPPMCVKKDPSGPDPRYGADGIRDTGWQAPSGRADGRGLRPPLVCSP